MIKPGQVIPSSLFSKRPAVLILSKQKKGENKVYQHLHCTTLWGDKFISSSYNAFITSSLHENNADPAWFCQEGALYEGDIIIVEHPPKFSGSRSWTRSKAAFIGDCNLKDIKAYALSRFPEMTKFATLQTKLGDQSLWAPAQSHKINVTEPASMENDN